MNLELVEERALSYLRQSRNPLVPVSTLLEHVQRDENCANTSEKILLDFLRHHEQVRIVEPPAKDETIDNESFDGAGVELGARAILNERLPTQREMSSLMDQQVGILIDSLEGALKAAEEMGEKEQQLAQIREALEKARALQIRMREHF